MNPRALELFDLPKLPRYRDEVLSLDSRRALTRGNPLSAVSFLAYLNPKRQIYTGILESDEGTVLGGIIQRTDEIQPNVITMQFVHFPSQSLDKKFHE